MAPSSKSQTWNNPGIYEEVLEPVVEAVDIEMTEPKKPVPVPQKVASAPTAVEPSTESVEADEPAKPMTDADWLRSKTTRLLELADDVDDRLNIKETPVSQDTQVMEVEQVQQTATGEEEPQVSEKDAAIEKISNYGRLFLRNLAYTTTEEDLRPVFAAFGPLKDVSKSFFFCPQYLPSSLPPILK